MNITNLIKYYPDGDPITVQQVRTTDGTTHDIEDAKAVHNDDELILNCGTAKEAV